jgi:pilus assembly protein CpaB
LKGILFMKRFLPLLIAAVIFVVALVMMKPEAVVPVVAAAADLPAGHILTAEDLSLLYIPKSLAPASEAYTDPHSLLGQSLRVYRNAGDFIYPANLGGEELALSPNERAIAIRVTDSSGLAGLVKPGDRVGVTAILPGPNGSSSFGKFLIGGLRVLYITPSFQAEQPAAQPTSEPQAAQDGEAFSIPSGAGLGTDRAGEGTVVLAVPVAAQVVGYDFSAFGAESDSRLVFAVDLLPALDLSSNVLLSLVLEPHQAAAFETSGIFLPDLVRTPGPTPTPSETPVGYQLLEESPTSTPLPALP